MENENKLGLDRKQMMALQVMALVAMFLTFLTEDKTLFGVALLMMTGLKALAMVLFEDKREAIFVAIYIGLAFLFFLNF